MIIFYIGKALAKLGNIVVQHLLLMLSKHCAKFDVICGFRQFGYVWQKEVAGS